jgi:hypothetical protein
MRIELFGNQSLVSSVAVEKVGEMLDIVINTRDRWPGFYRQGGSVEFMSGYNDERSPDHDTIVILDGEHPESDDFTPGSKCEVVLIPENDEEKALLNGFAYFSQEKDQLVCLKVPASMLAFRETIGSFKKSGKPHP